MDFVLAAGIVLLISQALNLVKYFKAKDWNGVVSIVAGWVIGVAVLLLAAQTIFANGFPIAGVPLSDLDFWSVVMVGMTFSSAGSGVYNFTKAVDANTSTKTPPLIKSPPLIK